MKPIKLILPLAMVILGGYSCVSQQLITDQTSNYNSGNPTEWSSALDAMIATPNNPKSLLKNEKILVLQESLDSRDIKNLHHHKSSSALNNQEVGDCIDSDADGHVIFDSRTLSKNIAATYDHVQMF